MLDDIKEALMYLNEKELKEVIGTCNILLAKDFKTKESDFYNIICQILALKISLSTIPLTLIRKSNKELYEKIIDTEETLNNYLDKHYKNCSKQNRLLFYSIVGDLILDKIKSCGVVITLSSYINFFKDFQSSFEKAFPGYIESGLLKFLLESRRIR